MSFKAGIFDELTPIYPDTDASEGFLEYGVAGCNGMFAGAHIMVNGLTPGLPLVVEVKGPHRCFKLFEMLAVPVEVNCGAKLRSEYVDGKINENVIRRAPFMVYEALEPFYNIYTPPYAMAAVAFKTPIEYCREFRTQTWEITVRHGQSSVTLKLNVDEYPMQVPKAGDDKFRYLNWMSFDNIARDHRCAKWSDHHFYLIEQYCRVAAHSRQNMLVIYAWDVFEATKDGGIVLNKERLDRIIKAAKTAGIKWFCGFSLLWRRQSMSDDEVYKHIDHSEIVNPEEIAKKFAEIARDAFTFNPEAVIMLTGEPFLGEKGEGQLASLAGQTYAYIQENGLTDVWCQCVMDEPIGVLESVYRKACGIVRAAMPGVPILEPTMAGDSLKGLIDIWVPSLDDYERQIDFYNSCAEAGGEIWVYCCLTPAGNYCNRLMDMERLRAVWIGWSPIVYPDIAGFLHWGGNHTVTGGPYRFSAGNFSENVMEFHPKHASFLPPGDAAIYYPGDALPLISARSEAHRIGFEDLYVLRMLKEKSPQRAAQLVNKVFRKFDDFEKDVAVYRSVKREVLEALLA